MKPYTMLIFISSAILVFCGIATASDRSTIEIPTLYVAGENVPEVRVRAGDDGSERKKAEKKRPAKPGYGGWGGPTPMVMFPNMSAFDPLTDALGIDSFPETMFLIGGMGMGQLGPNFRIGGGGAAGNIYTSGEVDGFDRSGLINIGYGGMVLYGMYPINDKVELFGRVLLGGGGFKVRIKGDDIEDTWNESEGFFAWHPAIGVAYHPVKWMSVELEGGYFGMILPEMHWEGETVIEDGLAGGPTAQLNILFGWSTKGDK